MGNNQCCESGECDYTFEIEKKSNQNNIILKGEKEGTKRMIVEDVDIEDDFEEFIRIINIILNEINNLSEENIIVIKTGIRTVLSEILNEEKVNIHLKNFENFFKNKNNLDNILHIVDIFKCIYDQKNKINTLQLVFFVKSISNILNQVKDFTGEKKKCFDKHFNKIYLNFWFFLII